MSRRIEMMIDLECAGPAPNGAIVSIGYCFFALEKGTIGPLEGEGSVGRIPVQVQSCVDIGMEIDEKTMREFWLKQPDEVRNLWGESGAMPIDQALYALSARYQRHKFSDNYLNIWAYPATYDLSILDRAFDLAKVARPFGRQQYLCARSALKGIGFDRSTVVIPEQWSTKHVPELDAVRQAIQLQTGLQPFVQPFDPCAGGVDI